MRPTIVTILTTATWESRLVAEARQRGMARIRARCTTAADVALHLPGADTLIVGAETPWITATSCGSWRATGSNVVAVAHHHDQPGRRLLQTADLILGPTTTPERMLAQIASLPRRSATRQSRPAITFVAPRGSPGCSEMVFATAWEAARRYPRVLLVEIAGEAPHLKHRLRSTPDIVPVTTAPISVERLARTTSAGFEHLEIPPEGGPLTSSLVSRLVESARQVFDLVVIDAGPRVPGDLSFDTGSVVLVVEPSSAGTERATAMVRTWTGPTPIVIGNKLSGTDDLRAIRRATGLEPVATVPSLQATAGPVPHPAFVEAACVLLDRPGSSSPQPVSPLAADG